MRPVDPCARLTFEVPRFKLTIAYDGTDFRGWQKQEPFASDVYPLPDPGRGNPDSYARIQGVVQREGEERPRVQLRTVQHIIERAVREIVREPIQLQGASRTDSGVHAKGQVAAFTCGDGEAPAGSEDGGAQEQGEDSEAGNTTDGGEHDRPMLPTHTGWPLTRGVGRLRRAINGRLPDDVQVVDAEVVPDSFDPIADCVSKMYSYTLHVAPPPPTGVGLRPLWDRRYVHHVWNALDVDAMRRAADRIVGTHDFAAFATAGHGRENTVRTVHTLEVKRLDPILGTRGEIGAERVRIEISGNGFLYNMVRIIAGTLVKVGEGKMTAEDVSGVIKGRNRQDAGPTLPPEGLCLERVEYGPAGRKLDTIS